MVRKVFAAAVVLILSVGFTFAEEIRAVITKVDGNKLTFQKMEGRGKDAKPVGEAMTLPVAKDVKVVNYKFNRETKKAEAGDAVEDGLKNKMFTSIGDKGIRGATIITDADGKKITEIRIMQRGGKKNKDK